MLRGFFSLDEELGFDPGAHGGIRGVEYGDSTGWKLKVKYYLPEGQPDTEIVFDKIISFRVHDEAEIIHYWMVRDAEGASKTSLFYRIEETDYMNEIVRNGSSGLSNTCKHQIFNILVATSNICVEVIGWALPTLARASKMAERP